MTSESPKTPPRAFDDDAPAIDGRAANGIVPTQLDGHPVEEISASLEAMTAEETIAWVLDRFSHRAMFATSFQKTSSVVVDITSRINRQARFFYIDTDVLFPETYATRDALAKRYDIRFERYSGISLEEQEKRHGASLWARQPDACCGIRKVQPMGEALAGARCWVAGLRRSDSQDRANTPKFAWDKRFGLWKVNPLVDWNDSQLWNHLLENKVPYNELHDQGYPSIGCTHCTSRPGAGEDARAGRWASLGKSECGLNG